MTQRVDNRAVCFSDEPFSGSGFSLYVGTDGEPQYRNLRILGSRRRGRRNGWVKGTTGIHDIANAVTKTARVATSATSPIAYALPAALASQDVQFNVRRFADDVENLSLVGPSVTLDASRDPVTQIDGTAILVSAVQKAGGIVTIRFRYVASATGTQPETFRAIATAGPSSPANVDVTADGGGLYQIDTPALLDSSAYTYTIRTLAVSETITKDLLTGISIQADTTGPPAPGTITTETF